jgi:hypothetical protein
MHQEGEEIWVIKRNVCVKAAYDIVI